MKVFRSVFLLLIFLVGVVFSLIHRPFVETDILKSVVKQENQLLLDINEHTNSDVIVMFKDESKDEFLNVVKTQRLGEIVSQDDTEYQKIIQSHPKSFLIDSTKKLIEQKQYKQLETNSMRFLYNPLGVSLLPIDKDPYFFVTDYFMSNFSVPDYPIVKIKTNNVGAIVDLAKNYDVYLAGTPVHSYKTAKKSAFQINIFGILATMFVLFICKYMFGSYKIFIPVISSILFGLATGYVVTSLAFHTIHILTFVFATTLIGIGVDYSLHYYSNKTHNKDFYKNLTSSMLTTIIAFSFLLIPELPLLNQISLYTISGLVGVYLFVTCVLPMLPFEANVSESVYVPKINKKWFVIIASVVIVLGFLQLKTDDSIKNLYKPDKSLKEAEMIYQHSTNPQNKDVSFIVTKDEGLVCEVLKKNNVDYIAESKFVPTQKEQKENIKLINNLYQINNYPDFLTKEQKNNLIKNNNSTFDYKIPSFYLNGEKIIIAYGLGLKEIPKSKIINIQKDISMSLKQSRKLVQPLIPILFLGMFVYLYLMYNKKALKIMLPPLIGVFVSVAFGQILGCGINIFSILTIFLIIGFTIDYSIFKSNGDSKTNIAVFSACVSTAFSFLLLSFAGFKLISTFGSLLLVGIISSYIASCIIFDDDNTSQQWFEIKERSAGVKRLKLSFYLYKMFGRKPLEWIAWWVGLFTYLGSSNLRKCSNKYFQVLYEYTKDEKYKPSFVNGFRHVYAYALSLVDKIEVYSGLAKFNFRIKNQKLETDLKKGGLFFIFTHVGNVEVMRAFIQNTEHKKVNIFMQKKHCETFNDFINSLSDNKDVKIFPVEDIGIETIIELKERLNNGEIVFMAGDRLSSSNTNKCYESDLLGKKISLPLGSLKFALMLEYPIYLISCIKTGKEFLVESEKFEVNNNKSDNLARLQEEFSRFLEKMTLFAPYQFYHFYDLFK